MRFNDRLIKSSDRLRFEKMLLEEKINDQVEVDSKKELMLSDFYFFLINCWEQVMHPGSKLDLNWHIVFLAHCCQAIYERKVMNMIINIQPRSLKSEIITVGFPCWEWLKRPGARFLCLSYASSLANTHNQERRLIIQSPFYQELLAYAGFADFELRNDKNRISEFANNYRGEMISRGFDGSVTGVGAGGDQGGAIIVDDPNNPIATESPLVRQESERKFKDYSVGRRNDPKNTPVLVVQQRCHVEDITGVAQRDFPERYTIHKMPVRAGIEAEEWRSPLTGEILHTRQPGELLHPSRFGDEQDEEARVTLGSYMYAARFKQEPIQQGGIFFQEEWFRYFRHIPEGRVALSIDASFGSLTESASYVAIQAWIIYRPNFYLWYQLRDRLTFPKLLEAVTSVRNRVAEELDRPIVLTLIENKANGPAIIQVFRGKFNGVVAINPKESKEARAQAASPTYEAGNVHLKENEDWIPNLINEHCQFPNWPTNDCLDAASQIVNYYSKFWRNLDNKRQKTGSKKMQRF